MRLFMLVVALLMLFGRVDAAPSLTLNGGWKVLQVNNKPPESIPGVIYFNDGRFSGQASCNSFNGEYVVQGKKLSTGQMAITRKACPEEAMMKEQTLIAAWSEVSQYAIDEGQLLLKDPTGKVVIKAQRIE